MVSLLDVNLLVALVWPNHVHHQRARVWFAKNQSAGWATCPVTESGLIRVSSNHRVTPESLTPREAVAVLQQVVSLPHHHFWEDAISFVSTPYLELNRLQGYRQVTDAHLLAIARSHGGRLATLDGGVRSLLPAKLAAECVVVVGENGSASP